MKKILVAHANLFQRLRGKEEFSNANDMNLVAMPKCESFYFVELPDIVYTPQFGTDERNIVTRNMMRDQKLEHTRIYESYKDDFLKA